MRTDILRFTASKGLAFGIALIAALGFSILSLTASPPRASSGELLIFAKTYIRETQKPQVFTDSFTLPQCGSEFKLVVKNGKNGSSRASAALIGINGRQVIGASDFSNQVDVLMRRVLLKETNEISVELRGKPGDFITVSITGVGMNTPPVADAGPDQTVFVGEKVTLDGSRSADADGNPLIYAWSFSSRPLGSAALLSDPRLVNPTFHVDIPGTYTLQLVVNDTITDSTPDTVSITTINSPPVANAGPDQTIHAGRTVTLNGSASSDADGDALAYSWSLGSKPADSQAVLLGAAMVTPSFVADLPGSYEVQLVVNDGHASSPSDTVIISAANSIPVADAGHDQFVDLGSTVGLNGSGSSDADGDLLSFRWSLLTAPTGSTAVLSGTSSVNSSFVADRPGTYVAQLIVNDGLVDGAADTVVISTLNAVPVARAGADQSVFVGETVTLDGSGSTDADGDALTFFWSLTAPVGSAAAMSDPSAVRPTFQVDEAGIYIAQLIVHDGELASTPDTVTIGTKNSPPVASAGQDQTVFVAQSVVLDGSGSSDIDGDLLQFSWSLISKPAGSLAVLADPSAVKPTFVADNPGVYVAQLIVSDQAVASAPDTVSISTDNSPPLADAGPDQTVHTSVTVNLDGSGSSDVDGDALTYSWSMSSKPPGSGAVISGQNSVNPTFVPDIPGDYLIQLIVHDGHVDSSSDTVTITTFNTRPVADAGEDVEVTLGETASLDGAGSSDADHDALDYQWSLISKPVGSTAELVDPATAEPSFTPDLAGAYLVQLIVNDGALDSLPDTTTVTARTAMAQVPNVVGLPQADAESAIKGAGFTVGVVTSAHSPTVPAGRVISQDPAAGASVAAGAPISLVVSLGPVMRTVPAVVGLTRAAAESAIAAANLTVGVITTANSNTVAAGSVISQNPAAGTVVPQGSVVDLVISLGPSDTPLPPDPSTVAPPLDTTASTSFSKSTEFLYAGTNPIQTGVGTGAIEPERVVVLRGKVLTREGAALSGVRIRILNHPEFGQTLSRADGMFDMAVNGGGFVTAVYDKDGYLGAQRQIQTSSQEFAWLPEVALIPLDARVTAVDLTSGIMQVARGNPVTDADGTRTATLFFPAGTTAQVVMQDGSTQPVTTLHIRATEYTVGENGQKAMPAELPPASAYTYAVELRADEAVAKINGKDTLFNQPVLFYLENFLSFPAGSAVPVGYYDADKAAWIASDNGRVIKILSITSGLANLDTDGNDTVDDGASIGVSEAERQQLASLYQAGQTLWRVPIRHLSTYDCNWPYGPPSDAEYPNQANPGQGGSGPNRPCEEAGSVIECQNQVLGENLRVAGTTYSLNYRSNRVPGHAAGRALRIPLSGAVIPDSVIGIRLSVEVAGQHWSAVFPAARNLVYPFTWDGIDGFGRRVSGWHKVTVRIGYVYLMVYLPVAADQDRAFARLGGYVGNFTVAARETLTITLWQSWHGKLSARLPEQGLGNWSLTPHHNFDPVASVLYRGDGRRLAGQEGLDYVTSIAAGGSGYCESGIDPCGDGGPATQALLGNRRDIAFGSDGSMYIAEQNLYRIRKVDPEGNISTVAGTGQYCRYQVESMCGDGGPATMAATYPFGLSVAADGSLYILESDGAVRRIRPDGIIEKVAGRNPAELRPGIDNPWDGDGGPAVDAFLIEPWDIACGPDGSVYVSGYRHHCVRQIGTDGYITTAAGQCGVLGFSGDGGPGPDARLAGPMGLSVGRDGSLYIADRGNYRIRRLRPDGTIETFAGRGYGEAEGDGGLAVETRIGEPTSVAAGRDGSVYLLSIFPSVIRRVGPDGIIQHFAGKKSDDCSIPEKDADLGACGIGGPARAAEFYFTDSALAEGPDGLYASSHFYRNFAGVPIVLRFSKFVPGISLGDIVVPSEDGQVLYLFDAGGRHLRTVDGYTGADRYRFTYDAGGLLSGITDPDGNITTLERDSSGNLTAIVGPYGHRTVTTLNTNGYLESVTDPSGGRAQMVYDPNGLLLTFTDANGNANWFGYDDLGRLTRDENAAGGTSTLGRSEGDRWREVAVTSGTGTVTTYRMEALTTGDALQVNRFHDGSETRVTMRADGSREMQLPDGSSVTSVQEGDPRFGMGSSVLASARVRTPSALEMGLSASSSADLTDPADFMSFTSLVEEVTVNGRKYRQVFDKASRTFTLTTPAGRIASSVLDARGDVVELRLPGIAPVSLGYDASGRLNSIQQGAGRQYQISYSALGRVQSVTDPLGRVEQFRFDASDRPTALISPAGQQTGFATDLGGNLTGVTPPGQPEHRLAYTPTDLLARYDPPSLGFGASTTVVYDADRRVQRIARSGQIVSVGYDAGGRTSSVTLPEGGGVYSYEYAAGRLSRATAPGGQVLDLTHDGFLRTGESWSGRVAGSVTLAYGSDFRPVSESVNGSAGVAFGYDQDGLLTSTGSLSIQRDPTSGLVTGTALGNVAETFGYDTFGNLASHTLTSGTSTIYSAQYTRDLLGRITEKREDTGAGARTFSYTYDAEARLAAVEIDGSPAEAYTYDPNGNRLTAQANGSARSATYDAQDRLLGLGTATYTYTLPGDLLARTRGAETTSYRYDELGNLLGVILTGGREIGYIVDARGRRVGKTVGGTLVQGFLYQDLLRPVAELDGAGAVVSRFVYGTQDNLPNYMVRDGRIYLLVADQLGSLKLVVDSETGAVAQRLEYDAFGNLVEDTNPGFQPFGFAGGIYDPNTRLVRFGVRDYDPDAGRWTAKDPIIFGGGTANLYEYALSDPVNLTDPTGLYLYTEAAVAHWLRLQAARSPWLAGFADGLTELPLTTSVAELVRDAHGVDDFTDYCSHRYRAGYSLGQSAGLVIAGIGMVRGVIQMGGLPARAIFGGVGLANVGPVLRTVGALKNAATVGSRFSREVGSRVGEAIGP